MITPWTTSCDHLHYLVLQSSIKHDSSTDFTTHHKRVRDVSTVACLLSNELYGVMERLNGEING